MEIDQFMSLQSLQCVINMTPVETKTISTL